MIISGKVHLYYGEGKGKTTAAVGLAVRAFGAGYEVFMIQFLKDGNSSEINVLRDRLKITVLAEKKPSHMSFAMTAKEKEETILCHDRIWNKAMDWSAKRPQTQDGNMSGKPSGFENFPEFTGRILILDEIIGAVEAGLFPEDELLSFLDERPNDLEVVLTGRNPSPEVLKRADYCSRILCAGHPFDKGTAARKGIEF